MNEVQKFSLRLERKAENSAIECNLLKPLIPCKAILVLRYRQWCVLRPQTIVQIVNLASIFIC